VVPDRVGFETSVGSRNSPFEAKRFLIGVKSMMEKVNEIFFVFIKGKDTNTRTN
jgi:cytochrome c556